MSEMEDLAGAYVDGELDLVTAKRFERAMAADPDLQARVERERTLRKRLSAHFDPVLDEPVPDRLTGLLETNIDTSLDGRRRSKLFSFAKSTGAMQWAAMAATLVVGIAIGGQTLGGGIFGTPQSVETVEGSLIAAGELETILETRLASSGAQANDAYRIGLTFRDEAGTVCRSFAGDELSGIACRAKGNWQLRRTYPGQEADVYRQAASSEMMAAIDGMIAGEALDDDAERDLRDADWD